MESNTAVLSLAALAQPTRLEVFRLLMQHEPEGIAAGEMARQLAVPQNTLSAHLAILSRAGLVASRRSSRSIIYRANLDALQRLMVFLIEDCCAGRPELCGPLVERLQASCQPTKQRRREPAKPKLGVAP